MKVGTGGWLGLQETPETSTIRPDNSQENRRKQQEDGFAGGLHGCNVGGFGISDCLHWIEVWRKCDNCGAETTLDRKRVKTTVTGFSCRAYAYIYPMPFAPHHRPIRGIAVRFPMPVLVPFSMGEKKKTPGETKPGFVGLGLG